MWSKRELFHYIAPPELPIFVHDSLRLLRGPAVHGLLVAALKPELAARFDDYIGSAHRKEVEEVEVATKEGERITVCVYVYINGPESVLEPWKWSPMQ